MTKLQILHYLLNKRNTWQAWMTPLKKMLNAEDFSIIFSNIELIRQFNQSLCAELEKRINSWSDTQKLGDVFVSMVRTALCWSPLLLTVLA